MMLRVIAAISATTTKPSVVVFFQSAKAYTSVPKILARGKRNHAKPVPLKFFSQKSGVWSPETVPRMNAGEGKDSNGGDEVAVLNYNSEAKAVEFFSNKFFYNGNKVVAELLAQEREEKFGNKTVKEVFNEIELEGDIDSYFNLFTSGYDLLRSFWNKAKASIESRLNGKILELVADLEPEITLVKQRYVRLPSSSYFSTNGVPDKRKRDICVVLGSSGSGKTFFALKDAAEYRKEDAMETSLIYSMIIYLDAVSFISELSSNPILLVERIKKKCFDETSMSMGPKLNMHVSVVIDEAGNEGSNYFEKIEILNKIHGTLCKLLAKSVRLIVSGTGLTAENLNSQSEVRKYRMRGWSNTDITSVARERFDQIPDDALEIVQSWNLMKSLTTNARTAWFLLESLNKYLKTYKLDMGADKLHKCKYVVETRIVEEVAECYIGGNGLSALTPHERRRVAAIVFAEVEKSKQEQHAIVPDFVTYTDNARELKMAKSLIDRNVECIDGNYVYVDCSKKSVLVSPAITIVLFHLLEAKATILSSWKGQEIMVALDAYRLLAISALKDKSNSLQHLQLAMLETRIPEPRATDNISIPKFGRETVWINADMAPFADVVAPFCLYQCKHTDKLRSNNDVTCSFNLKLELRKCGLLRNDVTQRGRIGWVTLNRLVKDWQDLLSYEELTIKPRKQFTPERSAPPLNQRWLYYPVDQLKSEERLKDPGINFIVYDAKNEFELLPSELTCMIKYVISTNADKLIVEFNGGKFVVASNDVNMEGVIISSEKLMDWENIMQSVRKNVTVLFHFG